MISTIRLWLTKLLTQKIENSFYLLSAILVQVWQIVRVDQLFFSTTFSHKLSYLKRHDAGNPRSILWFQNHCFCCTLAICIILMAWSNWAWPNNEGLEVTKRKKSTGCSCLLGCVRTVLSVLSVIRGLVNAQYTPSSLLLRFITDRNYFFRELKID